MLARPGNLLQLVVVGDAQQLLCRCSRLLYFWNGGGQARVEAGETKSGLTAVQSAEKSACPAVEGGWVCEGHTKDNLSIVGGLGMGVMTVN